MERDHHLRSAWTGRQDFQREWTAQESAHRSALTEPERGCQMALTAQEPQEPLEPPDSPQTKPGQIDRHARTPRIERQP